MIRHEQLARSVIDGGQGELIRNPGLQQHQFRVGQPGLRIEYKEVCFRAQLEFTLVGGERFSGQIQRSGRGAECRLCRIELVERVSHLAHDQLLHLAVRVEISSPSDQRVPHAGLCGSIPDGQIECKLPSVAWKSETEELAEGCAEPARGRELTGGETVLISSQARALVETVEFQVGLKQVVRQTNAGVIALQGVLRGFDLRTTT